MVYILETALAGPDRAPWRVPRQLDGPPYVFTNNLAVLKRRISAHTLDVPNPIATDGHPAGSEFALSHASKVVGANRRHCGTLSAERRHWRSNSIARAPPCWQLTWMPIVRSQSLKAESKLS